VGVRADLDSGPSRTWAAIGIEGLAPYFFEIAPTLYIGKDGEVAGRIEAFYELRFTQRLIAEPQAELNFYSKANPARGNGSGLSEVDSGLRLRYEINRKFAPYIGFAYNGRYGEAAAFARRDGEAANQPRLALGIRIWY
jgi:copper resistance protein B